MISRNEVILIFAPNGNRISFDFQLTSCALCVFFLCDLCVLKKSPADLADYADLGADLFGIHYSLFINL